MEGLIKGLIDVALGGAATGDGADDAHSPDHLDQRSRSTWAEVVSSGQNEDDRHNDHSAPGSSRKDGSDGDWAAAAGGKKQGSPARRQHQDRREEKSDGGWEVVDHKKQHSRRAHEVPAENWSAYKLPPNEQNYMDHVRHGINLEPTRDELSNLLEACGRLWELDSNRLVPGKDYEIDCGEGTKVYRKEDMVSGSLFRRVAGDVLRRPTYARFCSLLDNYNPYEGRKEVVTSQEKDEETAFIEEISRTAPIKYIHKYLASKGIISESNDEFKEMMRSLWFDLYGRGGGSRSSSAFEHVFVGEIKGRGENAVNGFHNWIQEKLPMFWFSFTVLRGRSQRESRLLWVHFPKKTRGNSRLRNSSVNNSI